MRKNIENRLKINCVGVDLTTLRNIEFYVRQAYFFGCYTPVVISPNEMVVTIPLEDAMKLRHDKDVKMQFAFQHADGNADASDVVERKVKDLLKEAGYDPL